MQIFTPIAWKESQYLIRRLEVNLEVSLIKYDSSIGPKRIYYVSEMKREKKIN